MTNLFMGRKGVREKKSSNDLAKLACSTKRLKASSFLQQKSISLIALF